MTAPVEIAWHNMDAEKRVANKIEERAARLNKLVDRLTHVRVVIEASHRRHQTGNRYEVRLDVGVPGKTLAIDRKPGDDASHFDIMVAVRDSFDAMERQLRRWNQQHKGRPITHVAPLQGRIAELDANAGSGQIQATDGRLVYFHQNAVVGGSFAALSVGDTVELVVDPGEDAAGAHASTVRPISSTAFVDKPG